MAPKAWASRTSQLAGSRSAGTHGWREEAQVWTVNVPMSRLVHLAENDLVNARDNLARARMAARVADVNAEWGNSGQTLANLIAGYEEWEREALAALKEAQSAVGK